MLQQKLVFPPESFPKISALASGRCVLNGDVNLFARTTASFCLLCRIYLIYRIIDVSRISQLDKTHHSGGEWERNDSFCRKKTVESF